MDDRQKDLDRILKACTEGTNIARDPKRAAKLLLHVKEGIRRRKKLEKDAKDKEEAEQKKP